MLLMPLFKLASSSSSSLILLSFCAMISSLTVLPPPVSPSFATAPFYSMFCLNWPNLSWIWWSKRARASLWFLYFFALAWSAALAFFKVSLAALAPDVVGYDVLNCFWLCDATALLRIPTYGLRSSISMVFSGFSPGLSFSCYWSSIDRALCRLVRLLLLTLRENFLIRKLF